MTTPLDFATRLGRWNALSRIADADLSAEYEALTAHVTDVLFEMLRRRGFATMDVDELAWMADTIRTRVDLAEPHDHETAVALRAQLDLLENEARTRNNPIVGKVTVRPAQFIRQMQRVG